MSSIDLWYTTRATGLVSLVLLTSTMFLGILTAGRAPSTLPAFARAEVHRRLSMLTVTFLAIHVLTAVMDTYVHINPVAVIIPFTASYHTVWLALGTMGVDLFLAVAISSALRQRIPTRVWRYMHWLAYLSWPVAVAHTLGMGTDMRLSWVLGLVSVCIAAVFGLACWRLFRTMRTRALAPPTVLAPRAGIRASIDIARRAKGATS
jgi:predicted ferric reductase